MSIVPQRVRDRLYRGVSEVFPDQPESENPQANLTQHLATAGRPLRVKLGVDPTGAALHLGHSIPLRKLRAFQDAGHVAVLIIGDFTAQIGDPTGKSEVRPALTPEQVQANAATYLDQVRPILDFDTPGRLEVRANSEWLGKLDLRQILDLLATMTVGQMLAKEGFAERHAQSHPVFLHEFLYPLMQGYDSVAVAADVELGGTDQKFNIAVGRDLQRHFGRPPQFGLLLPILPGTDGVQKMSKSLGNTIGLQDDPLTMYSKLEKIPDEAVKLYLELLTDVDLGALPDDPRACQKLLATTVVTQFHGQEAAQAAQTQAEAMVKGKDVSQTSLVPEFSVGATQFPAPLFYLLSAACLCASSSDARRQIQGGAVRLDGEVVRDVQLSFETLEAAAGRLLQVGKTRFVRLVP